MNTEYVGTVTDTDAKGVATEVKRVEFGGEGARAAAIEFHTGQSVVSITGGWKVDHRAPLELYRTHYRKGKATRTIACYPTKVN